MATVPMAPQATIIKHPMPADNSDSRTAPTAMQTDPARVPNDAMKIKVLCFILAPVILFVKPLGDVILGRQSGWT